MTRKRESLIGYLILVIIMMIIPLTIWILQGHGKGKAGGGGGGGKEKGYTEQITSISLPVTPSPPLPPPPPPPLIIPSLPSLTLLMSVYISNKQGRYDRWETFKYTLQSYTRMGVEWYMLYFFIELDPIHESRKPELETYLNTLFPKDKIQLKYQRFVTQESWRPFMNEVYGIPQIDRNVLFFQNDDHVFVDYDPTVFQEGLRLLEQDPVPYKSLYWSHWPEVIRLSGKLHNQQRIGKSYVRFNATLLDAIQVFNWKYLWKILVEVNWNGRIMTRIDGVALHRIIWPQAKEGDGIMITPENWQTVYIPLRELGRHFDGYMHVGMRFEDFACLELNRDPSFYTRNQTRDSLIRRFTASHSSQWTNGNDFIIPQDWIQTMLKLYGYESS